MMFTYIFLMATEFWVLFIEAKLLLSHCLKKKYLKITCFLRIIQLFRCYLYYEGA